MAWHHHLCISPLVCWGVYECVYQHLWLKFGHMWALCFSSHHWQIFCYFFPALYKPCLFVCLFIYYLPLWSIFRGKFKYLSVLTYGSVQLVRYSVGCEFISAQVNWQAVTYVQCHFYNRDFNLNMSQSFHLFK